MTRKTQKKLRKLLTLVCCAVMLVCVTVGATVAYLTSQDSVTNTFTVGNVTINLDEAKTTPDGKPVGTERTETGNTYKVFPGGSYTKDPTVTVTKGSEEAYVYMAVKPSDLEGIKAAFPVESYPTFYQDGLFLLEKLVDWNTDWTYVTFVDDTYIFLYKETVNALNAADDIVMAPLFTTISLPEDIDNDHLAELDNLQINVAAFAIQADGMDTTTAQAQAETAFAAIFAA